MYLNKYNGTNKWAGPIKLEIDPKHNYDTYKDMGKSSSLEGCKQIRGHFVFYAKHDARHEARLVADGNPTNVPLSRVYSGVASLRCIRLVIFLDELNELCSRGLALGLND